MFPRKDEYKNHHNSDLSLFKYFCRAQVVESRHEEIGDNSHAQEPHQKTFYIRGKEIFEFCSCPSNEAHNHKICRGDKFCDNKQFCHVLSQIVRVCLHFFVSFHFF